MRILVYIVLLVNFYFGNAQESLKAVLDKYNDETIPYIKVEELHQSKDAVLILDARELDEYNVSHIQNAVYVGYEEFSKKDFKNKNIAKNTKIVVYCSLGVRSEDISERLKKMGYSDVFNLYGGIFEWKNQDYPVVDKNEQQTDAVHPFSEEWGKWLRKGKKVYSY